MNLDNHTIQKIQSLLDEGYKLRSSNINESLLLTERAQKLSEEVNDPNLLAKSLSRLSLYYMIKGDFGKSMELAHKAIHYFETVDDKLNLADAKFNMASVFYKTDNYHLGFNVV